MTYDRRKQAAGDRYSDRLFAMDQAFVAEAAPLIKSAIQRHGGEVRNFHVNKLTGAAGVEFSGTDTDGNNSFIVLKLLGKVGQSVLELQGFYDGDYPTRHAKKGWWTIKSHTSLTPKGFVEEFWKIYYG